MRTRTPLQPLGSPDRLRYKPAASRLTHGPVRMPLPGTGFLAIWNDVVDGAEDEWLRWHTSEHMRERADVPGFLAARRYSDPGRGEHRYFTIYPADSLATFSGAPYRARLDNPTPWTRRSMPARRHQRAGVRGGADVGRPARGHVEGGERRDVVDDRQGRSGSPHHLRRHLPAVCGARRPIRRKEAAHVTGAVESAPDLRPLKLRRPRCQ